jgi:hypothetical protein
MVEVHSPSRERDLAYTLAVAVVALGPRLFVALAWSREPVWDGHYYHFGAERIAAGLGYSEDVMIAGRAVWKAWSHYPVGYSAFLAMLYAVFGSGLVVAPVANAVVGALIAPVVHRLARHSLSPNRARIAAALAAFHPGMITYSAVVMNELLTALLLLLAAFLTLHWKDRLRGVVAGAVAIGLGVLVRPTTLVGAPLLGWVGRGSRLPWPLAAALATGIAVAVALPWTIRNCAVMDGCAFVSTNGGWNLAIGAISKTGRFTTLRASDGCPVVTGQVQQDRCWAGVGRSLIASDFSGWLAKMPAKLSQTFDHESFAIEYLREAAPEQWPEERRVAGRELLTFVHRGLLVAATLGTLALPSRRRRSTWGQAALAAVVAALGVWAFLGDEHPFYLFALAIPVLAAAPLPGRPKLGPAEHYAILLVLFTALTHAVFFGDDRYHLVVSPALCLLAAAMLRRPTDAPPVLASAAP